MKYPEIRIRIGKDVLADAKAMILDCVGIGLVAVVLAAVLITF